MTDITQETIQYSLDNTLARLTSQKAKVSSIAKATTWDSQITAANKLVYQMGIDTTPSSFLNGQYIPAYDSQAVHSHHFSRLISRFYKNPFQSHLTKLENYKTWYVLGNYEIIAIHLKY